VKKLMLLVAVLSLAALGWARSAHSVLLDNAPNRNSKTSGEFAKWWKQWISRIQPRPRALRSTAE
jgi:hypothetical protein